MNNNYPHRVIVLGHDYQLVYVSDAYPYEEAEGIAWSWRQKTDSEGRSKGYRTFLELAV